MTQSVPASTAEQIELIRVQLQAPIADKYLSWKPGSPFNKGGQWWSTYFPYVNKEFLEERLDNVLGLAGWEVEYSTTEKDITICRLTLHLPGETRVTREGTGAHSNSSKNKNEVEVEADEVHGSRTRAFRDACRVFGICGRDITNTQTRPIKVEPGLVVDNKAKYCVPAEPLDRSLLIHSGAANVQSPSPDRGVVKASNDGHSSVRDPAAAAKAVEKDIKPSDTDSIVFPYGKKHNGQVLSTIPSHYLRWACENMSQLNPDKSEFNQPLHAAICIVLAEKAQAKEEKKEEKNQTPMDQSLEEMFGSEEES